MNKMVTKLISGYTFLMLLKKNKADDKCLTIKNVSTVDCSHRYLIAIPQDWDKSTKIINLTDTVLSRLDSFSFKGYQKLQTLIMVRTKIHRVYGNDLFQPLNNLRSIVLDYPRMPNLNFITWPNNLEELNISNAELTAFNATNNFFHLKRISLQGNNFLEFPELNLESPLESINVDSMDIIITTSHIVPYCWLRNLQASSAFGSRSFKLSENAYCECLILLDWMKNHSISSNFECPHHMFLQKDLVCQAAITETTLSKYDNCRYRGYVDFLRNASKFLIGLLIIPILIIILLFIRWIKRRYTCLILLRKLSRADDSDKCILSNQNNKWVSNCKSLNLDKIPYGLNEFINILNLTHSTIFKLTNDSFTPYDSLEVLDMFNVTIQNWDPNNWDVFSALNKLQVLNLSHSRIGLFTNTIEHQLWPIGLKLMNFSRSNLSTFVMVLPTPRLDVIDLSHNDIVLTPRMYLGPKVLHLNDNPRLLSAAEFFVTACRLEYVEFKLPFNIHNGRPLETDPFCTCELLKHWFNFTQTRHNLGECNFSTGVRCPSWFPQDWIDSHNECELTLQYWKRVFEVNKYPRWLIGLLLYLLGVLLVASFVYTNRIRARYRLMKARMKKDEENSSGAGGVSESEQDLEKTDPEHKRHTTTERPTTAVPPKLRKWKIGGK